MNKWVNVMLDKLSQVKREKKANKNKDFNHMLSDKLENIKIKRQSVAKMSPNSSYNDDEDEKI
jgi:flagellar hook-basal body complex protein FliE